MKDDVGATQDEWISARELANEIQVPVRTVLGWRQRGEGPASAKFGKHIRYRRSDVDAWITGRMFAQSGDAV